MAKKNRDTAEEKQVHKDKKGRGGGFFWKLLFLAALGVFCFSAYQLVTIYRGYTAGVDEYKEVEHQVVKKSQEPLVLKEQPETIPAETLEAQEPEYQPPEVDFEALTSMNPDVIGWIDVEALDISYPIVQGEDNDYYLHRTFKGQENFAGSIFVDYTNASDFSDPNTIIYGHNMKNGSMFGTLKQLYEGEKYKDSRYLWICTPEGKFRYEIFSLQYADVNSDTYTLFPEHGEAFGQYLENMKSRSEVDLGTEGLSPEDYIVTLSTCTSDDQIRFVVQARWVGTY